MAKDFRFTYKKRHAWVWGVFLILIAALVLANQFGGFVELGFWSLFVSALAVAVMVQCIVDLSFGSLPIPIAALYYIFQEPLGLPIIDLWPTLVLVTFLATAGLHILLPKIWFRRKKKIVFTNMKNTIGDVATEAAKDANVTIELGNDEFKEKVEDGGGVNNPRISVQFGSINRYLHADALETVELDCSFGSLEVYFDNVQLSPNGAEAIVNCRFGAIVLYVPSEWEIIDNVNASLGGVDIKQRHRPHDENAPKLKVSGHVSLGGMEIKRI